MRSTEPDRGGGISSQDDKRNRRGEARTKTPGRVKSSAWNPSKASALIEPAASHATPQKGCSGSSTVTELDQHCRGGGGREKKQKTLWAGLCQIVFGLGSTKNVTPVRPELCAGHDFGFIGA